MHPHTKQQLEAIYRPTEKNLNDFRNGRIGYEGFIAKQEELLKQALKSQAEMIRAEMPNAILEEPKSTERSLYLLGHNDHYLKTKDNLDELINSFK